MKPLLKRTVTWTHAETSAQSSFHYFAATHDRHTAKAVLANEAREQAVIDAQDEYGIACGEGLATQVAVTSEEVSQ